MNYFYFGYKKKKLSEKAKAERRESKRVSRIYEEFRKTKSQYSYDTPPTSPSAAKFRGMDVYWTVCKYGHVGERSIHDSYCPICNSVSRTIREAKIRGALRIKLSKSEKEEIASIYRDAKRLSKETGLQHHVDHVRPLSAGGLHHPKNLRITTAEENLKKGSLYNGIRRKYSSKEKAAARIEFKQSIVVEKVQSNVKMHNSSNSSDNGMFYLFLAAIAFFALLVLSN